MLNGDLDTSLGVRYGLSHLDLELLSLKPWLGFADGALPTYDELKQANNQHMTRRIYETKLLAGSHSEYGAQLVRKGWFFGVITLLSIFVIPFLLFFCSLWRRKTPKSVFNHHCLTLIVVIMTGALFIQILNTKMCSTFISIVLATMLVEFFSTSENDLIAQY
jgi:uncharacterized membrane protein YiaA